MYSGERSHKPDLVTALKGDKFRKRAHVYAPLQLINQLPILWETGVILSSDNSGLLSDAIAHHLSTPLNLEQQGFTGCRLKAQTATKVATTNRLLQIARSHVSFNANRPNPD
ncbi:MAG: hypothetical protein RH949_15155 [Coleofasciculus sp. A1-SPW-01]|uniref:hypothetical protein n=1 Tax=Coleofasciculus sp. A1-SPW-01 TaxID=3070819 RepID=UPI0033055339